MLQQAYLSCDFKLLSVYIGLASVTTAQALQQLSCMVKQLVKSLRNQTVDLSSLQPLS